MDEEAIKLEQHDAKDRQRRIDESNKAVTKELNRIFRLPENTWTQADKEFVRARQSYLSNGEKETYSQTLSERPDLQQLTIKELKEVAVAHRVPNWDKLEKKDELIAAIIEAQLKA